MVDMVLKWKVDVCCEDGSLERGFDRYLYADRGPVSYKPLAVKMSRGRAGDWHSRRPAEACEDGEWCDSAWGGGPRGRGGPLSRGGVRGWQSVDRSEWTGLKTLWSWSGRVTSTNIYWQSAQHSLAEYPTLTGRVRRTCIEACRLWLTRTVGSHCTEVRETEVDGGRLVASSLNRYHHLYLFT